MSKYNHAEQNAIAWADSIVQMVSALECDYERLEELREERDSLAESDAVADAVIAFDNSEDGRELAELEAARTIDGDKMDDADAARERIQESPLSVEVRSGWYGVDGGSSSGNEPQEFRILLTTGGPALQIRGELVDGEPSRAWLEYQDWGTPWTQLFNHIEQDTLLTFCREFYFRDV